MLVQAPASPPYRIPKSSSDIAARNSARKCCASNSNILAPLSQRRQMNLDRIQPKQQILPESARRGLRIHIHVRRRDHPYIHAPRTRRSHAFQFSGLQHAQQLCLQLQRHVRNLIQKQRPVVRQFESPHAIHSRIRKCALHMPEQLALKHPFRQPARIHRHHRHARAAATARAASAPPLLCQSRARP